MMLISSTGCKREPGLVDASGTRLPAPPAFMEPVPMQKFRKDQDARDALARERGSLKEANSRLRKSKAWYLTVRKTAGGGK
jgi:hypothetical protein